jgi:hypothetical protein
MKAWLSIKQDGDLWPIDLYGDRIGWVSSRPNGWRAQVTWNEKVFTGETEPTPHLAFENLAMQWAALHGTHAYLRSMQRKVDPPPRAFRCDRAA